MEDRINELLAKMTLTDKVGEMTQLAIDMISVGEPYKLEKPHQLDQKKLKKVLLDLRVGSILNVGGYAYSRDHWFEIHKTIQDIATIEKPTGIPVLYGIDAIHGANYTQGSILFPQQIGLAATWNPTLATRMGEVTAYETRASGIPWNFSPVLDIGRDPRWSRHWETFGEDVLLATEMGLALIKGYEGDDLSSKYKVASCLKHFLGYSLPKTGKDRTPAHISERQLREYFLPTFKAAIDAGVQTIMINSGEINGIPVHCNPKILKDLLRDELGFEGLVVTDWEDIKYLTTRHRVAENYKAAIRMAVNAGIDMSMVALDYDFPVLLKELVEEGKVSMKRIDKSVRRILKVKLNLGLFEHPYFPKSDYPMFASKEHQFASLKTAEESITLLKNKNSLLPLSKSSKVLVTGLTANSLIALNGGWGRTWQGNEAEHHLSNEPTILEAIRKKTGEQQTTYVPPDMLAHVMISDFDLAIVCIGEMPYCEKDGDLHDLRLSADQVLLVEQISDLGKPIALILVEGRPRIINDIENKADAVILAYLPGDQGGTAIANILFGDVNPSGKLPYTYPRHSNDLLTYDHKGTELVKDNFHFDAFDPQWQFGYGLSYTTFKYENLNLNTQRLTEDVPLEIKVSVTNIGNKDGKEVVQLYISDKVASITPSVKRLRGFIKIALKKGATKEVSFTVFPKDLAFVGIDNNWVTEPGEFEVMINNLTERFIYEQNKK